MSTDNMSDKIAQRAYELFVERGGKNGTDMDDWLRAEREVKSKSARSASVNAAPAAAPKPINPMPSPASVKKTVPPASTPRKR
jgi:hypothetical protein